MPLFKKKEEMLPEMPPELAGFPTLPPVPELPPFSPDMTQPQIRDLTARGYPSSDVLQGMQSAQLRPASVSQLPPMPQAPRFRLLPSAAPSQKSSTEEIEEVAEAIIAEKWQRVSKDFDDIKRSQEDLSSTISGMQERITSVEKKMDMVIQEILGKVEEYGRGISDVGTELKAMQKVFGTVMPTFTENIKELQEMVGEAKEKGFKKPRRKK